MKNAPSKIWYLIWAACAFCMFVMCGQNPSDTSGNIGAGVVPAVIGIPVVAVVVVLFVGFVVKDTRKG